MSHYTLGKKGLIVCSGAYLMLLFSLSCAFVSGGSSMIKANLAAADIIPPNYLISCIYILVIAYVVYKGHTVVDWCNRILISVKGLCFILLFTLLCKDIQMPFLLDTRNSSNFVAAAIPVLFFSFGLQIVVPSVFYYLDKDIQQTRKSIILGSLLPFGVYLLWLIATLGILPRYGDHSYADFLAQKNLNNIGDFFLYINKNSPLSTLLIISFAHIAIATSYATVALGLKDFLKDTFKLPITIAGNRMATLLAFVPTFILLIYASDIFQQALNFSAAVITIVLIFMPLLMVSAIRKTEPSDVYTVSGGKVLHYTIATIGTILFITGLLASANKLPTLF